MPVSRNDTAERAPEQQEVKRVIGIKDTSQLPTKRTINLCMREKDGMSVETFLMILALIILVVILIEMVGVYLPYTKVEILENEVAAERNTLAKKQEQMKDFDDVREYFNKYNYSGFDMSIADRLDVLDILERTIMSNADFKDIAKIRSVSIRNKTVTLQIDGLDKAQIAILDKNLRAEKLVENVIVSTTSYSGDVPTTSMSITLKDASTVPAE